MRQAMGVAVFSGMIGVTVFGLVLTPVFYYLLRRKSDKPNQNKEPENHTPSATQKPQASVAA
jgi:multidrug efflux pump